MSGTLAVISNGQDGVVVEDKLNAQILRYNESWRQILAFHTTGASKTVSRYAVVGPSAYLAGGAFDIAVDYDEDTAMSGGIWTVPVTGTYIFSWRDLKFAIRAGGHPDNAQQTGYSVGIGLWVGQVFYRLQPLSLAAHISPSLTSTFIDRYNGMSSIDLTVGQEIEFGVANVFGSSSSHVNYQNMHDQGIITGYIDVYTMQTGVPS